MVHVWSLGGKYCILVFYCDEALYKPLFSMSALSYAGRSLAPLSASSATSACVTTKFGEVTSLFSSATPRRKLGRNFL